MNATDSAFPPLGPEALYAPSLPEGPPQDADLAALQAQLARRGVATAQELAAALGRSQPTVSRALAALQPAPLVLGRGRNTRYALGQSLHGAAPEQTLNWVHEDGRIEAWGRLAHLAAGRFHVAAPGIDLLTQGRLPWFLTPLRAEGFLGRALARRLVPLGLPDNPEQWSVAQQLFAALHTPDAPGAIVLGEPQSVVLPPLEEEADFDRLADVLAAQSPVGSSAGGEQAKFLAQRQGKPVLVKFSPPRGTPFGERWHALLHLEWLALQVLGERGVPVATSEVVETARRTHLVSTRFDRVGRTGRRHVVALTALHDSFIPGPRQHWAASARALAQQKRLPAQEAEQVKALLHFGRLIGNTDMHYGNLSFYAEQAGVAAGRVRLAPLYDMLPMRWRPDVHSGELGLTPFEPMEQDLQSAAREPALAYWQTAAEWPTLGKAMRTLAATMVQKLK
jgi:HipA-like C-terminal domain